MKYRATRRIGPYREGVVYEISRLSATERNAVLRGYLVRQPEPEVAVAPQEPVQPARKVGRPRKKAIETLTLDAIVEAAEGVLGGSDG